MEGNEAMTDWRKPKRGFANGNCVEVSSGVQVRDSKDRDGVVLRFSLAAWRLFIEHTKQ